MDTGVLIEAVREQRAVELDYGSGTVAATRIVHPHAVFRSGSRGLCLDAVQVGGPTTSGSLPGWRQFALMRISDVRVLDVRFEIAPDYDPKSERYRHGLIAAAGLDGSAP